MKMRKNNIINTLIFLLLFNSSYMVMGQGNIDSNLSIMGPIPVQKPILLDSVNLQNRKFSDKDLLYSKMTYPNQTYFKEIIKPNQEGIYELKRTDNEHAFYLVSFYINANFLGSGRIMVRTPNPCLISVDGSIVAEKVSIEPNLDNAKIVSAPLHNNNNTSRIVIKYMISKKSTKPATFQLRVKPNSSDTNHTYTISNQLKRNMLVTDVLDGKRVMSSSISPSGRFVLLNITKVLKGGKRINYKEVYDTKQNATIINENALTHNGLNWMPSSDLLSYTSDTSQGLGLFSLDPLTKKVKVLASGLPRTSFRIAPDEKSVFFSIIEKVNIPSPKHMKRLLHPGDRQPYYRERYYIYQHWFDSGLSQQLTFGTSSAMLQDISNDSQTILFNTATETITKQPFSTSSLFRLHLKTMKVDTLLLNQPNIENALFSPNGKQIIILGNGESFNGLGRNIEEEQEVNLFDKQAFIMNISSREIIPITKKFNPSIRSLFWSKNDNNIYLTVDDKDSTNVYKYFPKHHTYERLPLKEEVIRSFNIANNNTASYTGVSVSNSARTYTFNLRNSESKLISDPFKNQLEELNLGAVRNWSFKTADGTRIEGRYYLPPNFNISEKYPLIVHYYGGAETVVREFESNYPLHVYAAQGYIVYTLSPSGTVGFGQSFSARHVNAWGDYTANDIIDGTTKFIAEHSFVDAKRVACIGTSYGGFITQYLQTKTDLFTTAVSHAGVSSISSYWGQGYWGYSYGAVASTGSYPWNNKELYVDKSPLFNADKINTPLLLLHGSADKNVPIGESLQLYTALKILGKPVEFIEISNEGHIVYDYNKQIEWNNTILAWFAKWLKDDSRWWNSMYP